NLRHRRPFLALNRLVTHLKPRAMYNRSIPVINTGSMADIAFLLLVFFLITTTLNEEMGIKATLPPSNPEMNSTPRADRNVLEILINGADELMIDGQKTATANIRQELRN